MAEINLIPWRELKRETERKQCIRLFCLSFITALCVIYFMFTHSMKRVEGQASRNRRLNVEISLLDSQIQEIKHLKEERNGLISRIKIIDNLQSKRTLTAHLFVELMDILPSGVYLKEFKRERDEVMLIGNAEFNADVASLMRNIQLNPWIERPVLTEIKKDNEAKNSGNNEFNVRFTLRSRAMPAMPL